MAKEESRLGEKLQRVHHLKNLGSSVEETGMTTEISQRVSAAWGNWKRCMYMPKNVSKHHGMSQFNLGEERLIRAP